jgi:predicted amidohydrolase YtcJ
MRVDTLITGGKVLLPEGLADAPVAVRAGELVAIGDDCRGVRARETIDAGGGLVAPGFQDAHVHPILGGLRMLGCDMSEAATPDEAKTVIRRGVQRDELWLIGGGWAYEWFEGGCPDAGQLDELTGDKPAYLVVRDGHSAWVNSEALRRAGIGPTTPDPPDGRIERLPDGTPQGTLHEGAMELVERVVPEPTDETLAAALLAGQRRLFSCGVTAWQDAWVTPEYHEVYRRLASSGELAASVRGALWWDRTRGVEQLGELEELAGQTVGSYDPGAVKLMLDGVVENFTASMIDPYIGDHGFELSHRGLDFIGPSVLGEVVSLIRLAGLQCHFHAIGDAAVRSALDSIEMANARVGSTEHRDHISHIQVIHPRDRARFARSGAIANCQTLWACNDPSMTDLTLPFLGDERARWQYPFRSIAAVGGRLAMGSDWPVSSPDVLDQMHVAVTRTPPDGEGDPLGADEALTVPEVFEAWTAGSAFVNHLDTRRGAIAVGNVADLVVLDGDPFVPDARLPEVGVEVTMVGGEVVFENGSGTG